MSDLKTVAMRRAEPQFAGGPLTADVHPEEVANYTAAGWERADGKAVPAAVPIPVAEGEKPVAEQSLFELRRTAKALGVKFTPKTKLDELRTAVIAAMPVTEPLEEPANG